MENVPLPSACAVAFLDFSLLFVLAVSLLPIFALYQMSFLLLAFNENDTD